MEIATVSEDTLKRVVRFGAPDNRCSKRAIRHGAPPCSLFYDHNTKETVIVCGDASVTPEDFVATMHPVFEGDMGFSIGTAWGYACVYVTKPIWFYSDLPKGSRAREGVGV